jgi:hypothetical protein
MNRHYADGFRRGIINDLNDVEPQLQEYDSELYIMYNQETGEHLIMDGLVELAIMRIPQIGFPNLNSSVVRHIKKIHTANGFKASSSVDAAEEAIQREVNRKKEDMSYNLAKDTEKHVRKLAHYGA